MAGGVFISYRRGVDSHAAGRLHDRLASRLGRKRVFIDVDDIEVGADFVARLDGQLAQSQAVLVVIGPGWHAAADRLSDPDDFVRREIAAALSRPEIRVIPVLVDGAPVPAAEDLPAEIAELGSRNGFALDHTDFTIVADRIAHELGAWRRRVLRATGAAGGVVLVALAGWIGTGALNDRAAAADCDRLAAHPDDPNRTGPGVRLEELDGAAATAACETAASAYPENTRFPLPAWASASSNRTGRSGRRCVSRCA